MGLRAVQPLQLALVVRPVPGATSFPLQLQTDPLDAAFRTHVPLHARTPPYTPLRPLNIPLQALRYVSFPLQTLSKSAKSIPVMAAIAEECGELASSLTSGGVLETSQVRASVPMCGPCA